MIYLWDKNKKYIAVLENAFNVSYEKTLNQLWRASFTLPLDDRKATEVNVLQFVEIVDDDTYENIGLFRVLPKKTVKNINEETITFELEHVLGTLLGRVLFKYHQLSGYTISQVIEYVLNKQGMEKPWVLGKCDFTYKYDYYWENENLLSALFSITKSFQDNFMWTYDTSSYPWKINLERIPTTPTARITEGYNLTGLEVEENPNGLWNRIYPLGSAEGVNQVDIRKVNNGNYFIEDSESIAKYGLYATIFVDKEITDDKVLLAVAKKKLKEWKEPLISWNVKAVDLSSLTGISIDRLKIGSVVRIQLEDYGEQNLLIVKESKRDAFGSPEDIELELGNLGDTLASANAEQMRRQRVSDLYSQGATNILNFGYQDNCDNNTPALITFYLDDDVVNVNTCELTFETKKFRAYSSTTESGGSSTNTSTSGGGVSTSTASGGGVSTSTASGGGTSTTSQSGGGSSETTSAVDNHRHAMFGVQDTPMSGSLENKLALSAGGSAFVVNGSMDGDFKMFYTESADGGHSHSVSIPSHTHSITIPSHTHSMTIPSHTHDITIPAHSHNVSIPAHTHGTKHEIVELDSLPSGTTLKVDGKVVPVTALSQERLDIIPYLNMSDGKVSRGKHTIEIYPYWLARIEANLILRVFIQSQLGGKY